MIVQDAQSQGHTLIGRTIAYLTYEALKFWHLCSDLYSNFLMSTWIFFHVSVKIIPTGFLISSQSV